MVKGWRGPAHVGPWATALLCLLVAGFGSPARALADPCVLEDGVRVCPYSVVGAYGQNSISDVDITRCTLGQGCVDIDGNPCSTDGPCTLKAVPPGWCSEGTNFACLWPNPVGRCSVSAFACVTSSDCPSGESCGGTVDQSCRCTNDNDPVTGVSVSCGGREARCSDGDSPVGGGGLALCTDLVLGDESDFTNCGSESGQPLSGPRWQSENPGAPQTLQRKPGSGYLLATGPNIEPKERFALEIGDPDALGVRRLILLGDSFHSDWVYVDKAAADGIVNSHIVPHTFDTKLGWETQLPVDGRCTSNPDWVCIQNADCLEPDTCDPETFVYGHEAPLDSPFFLWTQDIADPNDPSIPKTLDKDGDGILDPDCPPVCGINYYLNSFEEEQVRVVGGLERDLLDPLLPPIPGDREAGVQLALNVLKDGPAGRGDLVGVSQVVALVWLPAVDMRCSIGGDPDRKGICADERRCEGGLFDGELCSVASDCGGTCVGGIDEGEPCELDKDCREGGICPRCLNVDCATAADCVSGACLDKRIGRCSAGPEVCSPFTELNIFNTAGTTDDCRTTTVDAPDTFTCQFCGGPFLDPNAPLNTCLPLPSPHCQLSGEPCSVDSDCFQFTSGRSDVMAGGGNPWALPIGYNDHGLEALTIDGRISGINGLDVKVRVPLYVLATTGAAGLEFRDNDGGPASIDRKSLGPIQVGTGGRGLGLGGSFPVGTLFPAFGYEPDQACCGEVGSGLAWPPTNPGNPEGSLAGALSWGLGADRIPGCIGDNDPAFEPTCQFPLGIFDPNVLVGFVDPNACFGIAESGEPVPGCNTGLDDPTLTTLIDGVERPAVIGRRKVENPAAPLPTLYYVAAGSARDLDVAGSWRNADALFKVEGVWCPIIDGVPVCGEELCGNNVVDPGEECDDGNRVSCDGCSSSCVPEGVCGDGVLEPACEECDDGELNSDTTPDACRTTCESPSCGDGVADAGEECDNGEQNSDTTPDACRTICEDPSCGDAVTDAGEACDDGNEVSCDGCSSSCEVEGVCGDGVLDPVCEECDEGELNSDTTPDACRLTCENPDCGDGVTDGGEECDDGPLNSDTAPDACRTSCEDPRCGDGVTDTGERCDDGNLVDGDGCESDCSVSSEFFRLLSGRYLKVREKQGRPSLRRLAVLSKDASIVVPGGGTAGDPTLYGAELLIVNPTTGEGSTPIPLPASFWTAVPELFGSGYAYRDVGRSNGPCQSVYVKPEKSLRALCGGSGIPLTLDEESQGSLTVTLRLGSELTYCMSFGGTIHSDYGVGTKPGVLRGLGRFRARSAPAPAACPLP